MIENGGFKDDDKVFLVIATRELYKYAKSNPKMYRFYDCYIWRDDLDMLMLNGYERNWDVEKGTKWTINERYEYDKELNKQEDEKHLSLQVWKLMLMEL